MTIWIHVRKEKVSVWKIHPSTKDKRGNVPTQFSFDCPEFMCENSLRATQWSPGVMVWNYADVNPNAE